MEPLLATCHYSPVHEAGMLDLLLAVLSSNAEGFSILYQFQLIEELTWCSLHPLLSWLDCPSVVVFSMSFESSPYLAYKSDSGLGIFFGSKMLNEKNYILRRKTFRYVILQIKSFPTLS